MQASTRGKRGRKTKKPVSPAEVSDEEIFARLIFYGTTLLGRKECEVWLMPLVELLDQWEIYKQYNRIAKPKKQVTIDDIIPLGLL